LCTHLKGSLHQWISATSTLEPSRQQSWKPSYGDGVGWHTLRHTFASRLAMSGQTEGTIATLMRHSTTALVRRYAHLSPSYLHAAVETVAAYGKPTMKGDSISDATVIKTGKNGVQRLGNRTEVIESVGAGDGI
jgi:hypothetical protein